jgi:hypothetical protein
VPGQPGDLLDSDAAMAQQADERGPQLAWCPAVPDPASAQTCLNIFRTFPASSAAPRWFVNTSPVSCQPSPAASRSPAWLPDQAGPLPVHPVSPRPGPGPSHSAMADCANQLGAVQHASIGNGSARQLIGRRLSRPLSRIGQQRPPAWPDISCGRNPLGEQSSSGRASASPPRSRSASGPPCRGVLVRTSPAY